MWKLLGESTLLQIKGGEIMSNQEYNGWTNWETWNFKLWIDNSEDSYKAVIYVAEEVKGKANAKNNLAKELESLANDLCEESVTFKTGFFTDVCNSAIKQINFYEIAESYLEEK
tara:strand:+ start:35 stop:376 length:342 start_codon:yes stop_codon:yes gene_type:complete